jgi:hypothetical protein
MLEMSYKHPIDIGADGRSLLKGMQET